LGKKGDNYDRFLIRIKEILESFRLISQVINFLNIKKINNNNFFKYNNYVYMFNKKFTLRGVKIFYKKFLKLKYIFFKNKYRLKYINSFYSLFYLFFFLNLKKKINKINYSFNFQNLLFSNFSNNNNFKNKFSSMEETISHFKYYSEGFSVPAGISYQNVESPKGYVGVILISDGSTTPYRCKMRTPVSHNMHLIPTICTGLMFADFVATFCSLDIVLGEIDR